MLLGAFCTHGLLITDAREGECVEILTALSAQYGLEALCILPDLAQMPWGSCAS